MHVIGRSSAFSNRCSNWMAWHRRHMVNWPIPLSKTVLSEVQERFPFNLNVWLKFSAISSSQHGEWNSIFENIWKIGQPRKVYLNVLRVSFSRKFFCHWTLLPDISRIFEVESWLAFRNLNSFRNFWKLFRKFLHHLSLFPNFGKFWLVNGKRPKSSLLLCFLVVFVPSTNIHSHGQAAAFFVFVFIKNLRVRSPSFRSTVEHNGLGLGNKPRSAHWCQVQRLNLLYKSEKVIWRTVEPPLKATSTTNTSLQRPSLHNANGNGH